LRAYLPGEIDDPRGTIRGTHAGQSIQHTQSEENHAGEFSAKGKPMAEKRYRKVSRNELDNPDYSFIKRDLRRIVIIAGSFVVVMIILSFILR
jgi:hypothetical protein